MLRIMYQGGGIQNPIAQILREQDTLRLTGDQADSLATLNRWYSIRVDSIWAPVYKYLADLPDTYDRDLAWERYLRARRGTIDLLSRMGPSVKGVLTPAQRRKLPPYVSMYLEPTYLANIRSGTNAYAGGMPMMGGGAPVMIGGGGGAMTIQVRQP
jgi:hypothetical protein